MSKPLAYQDILNSGHVALERTMGGDLEIVNNAKVSFDKHSDEIGEHEKGLINFLMRERHGSPFEAPVFRFNVRAPLFVIQEWLRHRISSFNQESGRYSVLKEEFYIPEISDMRVQVGRPGNYSFDPIEDLELAEKMIGMIVKQNESAFKTYHELMDLGLAKELARTVLPHGAYASFVWTVNLRSLLNFLSLRNHEHAQREIGYYAAAIEEMITTYLPVTMAAFEKNGRVAP